MRYYSCKLIGPLVVPYSPTKSLYFSHSHFNFHSVRNSTLADQNSKWFLWLFNYKIPFLGGKKRSNLSWKRQDKEIIQNQHCTSVAPYSLWRSWIPILIQMQRLLIWVAHKTSSSVSLALWIGRYSFQQFIIINSSEIRHRNELLSWWADWGFGRTGQNLIFFPPFFPAGSQILSAAASVRLFLCNCRNGQKRHTTGVACFTEVWWWWKFPAH